MSAHNSLMDDGFRPNAVSQIFPYLYMDAHDIASSETLNYLREPLAYVHQGQESKKNFLRFCFSSIQRRLFELAWQQRRRNLVPRQKKRSACIQAKAAQTFYRQVIDTTINLRAQGRRHFSILLPNESQGCLYKKKRYVPKTEPRALGDSYQKALAPTFTKTKCGKL